MMSHNFPLITVGVACYNASDTIARALASAIGQDWPNFEVVVVDDGSTDDSWDIVRSFAERDPRIRAISHEGNCGCATARNTVLKESQGVFVAFFDDDDVSYPERIRRQYEYIVSYENYSGTQLVACYASGTRYYPNGYKIPLYAIGSRFGVPTGTELVDFLLTFVKAPGKFFGTGTPTCSLMARAETFATVGGFDVAMRRQEDADFAVRLGLLGGHFIGTPEALFDQYSSVGSGKSAYAEHESLLYLLNKNREYLTMKGLYDYMCGWAEIRFRHFNREPLKALGALLKLGLHFPGRTCRHFSISTYRRFKHEKRINASE